MDCVECETCKIHAKLQMLGIGTALKVLLPSHNDKPVNLQRNEVSALINTFHKFSESMRIVAEMRHRRNQLVSAASSSSPPSPSPPSLLDANGVLYAIAAILGAVLIFGGSARRE